MVRGLVTVSCGCKKVALDNVVMTKNKFHAKGHQTDVQGQNILNFLMNQNQITKYYFVVFCPSLGEISICFVVYLGKMFE